MRTCNQTIRHSELKVHFRKWFFIKLSRALDIDMHCLEAIQYQVVYTLCREGNHVEVSSLMNLYKSFMLGENKDFVL